MRATSPVRRSASTAAGTCERRRRSPRLAPLPREQWGDDARAALRGRVPERVAERFCATGPDARARAQRARHAAAPPDARRPVPRLQQRAAATPTLDARLRELMILRVAWRTGSTYEWAAAPAASRPVSASRREEIDAVAAAPSTSTWSAARSRRARPRSTSWSTATGSPTPRGTASPSSSTSGSSSSSCSSSAPTPGSRWPSTASGSQLDADLPTTPTPPTDIEE